MAYQELKSRDRLMAVLDVEGVPPLKIAEFLGCHVNKVYEVRKSPLYQVIVEDLRERLYAKRIDHMNGLVSKLHEEADASLEKVVALRDNGDGLTPHNVQLSAATSILDRVMPKKTEQSAAEQNRVVIISEESLRRMTAVLAEAGAPTTPTRRIEQFIEEAQTSEARDSH